MRQCHEVDYAIVDAAMQLVELELASQENVVAEAGVMNYMQKGIVFETRMGDGTDANQGLLGKLFSASGGASKGES